MFVYTVSDVIALAIVGVCSVLFLIGMVIIGADNLISKVKSFFRKKRGR